MHATLFVSDWFTVGPNYLLLIVGRVAVYFCLFGFAAEPFLELIPSTTDGKLRLYKDKTGDDCRVCNADRARYVWPHPVAFSLSLSVSVGSYRTNCHPPGSPPGPEGVRQESGLMRADFNARLRQVAFNSICSAYYTTFVPCAFTQVNPR